MHDPDDLELGPHNQFLPPELVLTEMAQVGAQRACRRTVFEVVVLSMLAGAFITVGALFSTLIATGTENEGLQRLLEGVGFSAGFLIVVLSGALLFTEVNVEMPATLLHGDARTIAGRVGRLWILAAAGNLGGAFLTGVAISVAQSYSPGFESLLGEIVDAKMRYREIGGLDGWGRAVLSGALGNWLVGMAAFLAVMGRTIIGKYIPVLLTVSAFVAAGFMHSPANMAFFSLATPEGIGPGWGPALAWSIAPAAVGNVLGAFFLVALPFWLVNRRREAATHGDGGCAEIGTEEADAALAVGA
ncbi:MAG: formate/nitrite transporter family protein [Ilumatobacteraceae bacterium]